ncbi:MAG: hypothetical protein M1830_001637 [Pleopsidium flavum]|nr:MAG: hypothetical protein M1830_001637 [Pleopsidium flavum]
MALRRANSRFIVEALLPHFSIAAPSIRTRTAILFSRQLAHHSLPWLSLSIPVAIHLNVPPLLAGLWESILRAVPKKKTSHMKKRHRFMAGKALKDVTNLNKCSACGTVKRAHLLCPYCVKDIKDLWLGKKNAPEELTSKSKQYLTTHTIDDAHITDIYSLAVTPTQVLSSSGGSSLKVHTTTEPDFPVAQSLNGAHKLGCHHVVTSKDGKRAASAGFAGEVRVWSIESGSWAEEGEVLGARFPAGNAAGEAWAIALSQDGQYLASTTYNGRINVWDTFNSRQKIREFETKGSFGMCIDLVSMKGMLTNWEKLPLMASLVKSLDGRFTASGHANGGVYIFNNDTGRMLHSLPGLVKPVRAVAFSPGGKLLAATGDSRIIAIYDVSSGEQVASLTGHAAWVFSLDWSDTGEFLLSGAFDGKVKVWSIDQRSCVATHTETDKTLWSVKWLPKTGRSECFATAGANRSISFYREATGG